MSMDTDGFDLYGISFDVGPSGSVAITSMTVELPQDTLVTQGGGTIRLQLTGATLTKMAQRAEASRAATEQIVAEDKAAHELLSAKNNNSN